MDTARRRLTPLRRPELPVPTGDLHTLDAAARRTTVTRFLLLIALLALLAGAVLFARGLDSGETGLLPTGRSGVVVLVHSRSVDPDALRRTGGVLRNLIRANASVGLVVFSDVAYELLPPRTPARRLEPMLRFFTETHGRFPDNPWAPTFRAGTRISQGLEIARAMIVNGHVRNGSILLVSDLGTSSGDEVRLTRDLVSFRRGTIPLRIVPLNPLARDREFFGRLLGTDVFVASTNGGFPGVSPSAGLRSESSAPVSLLVAGGALLCLLALNELWCGRLELPRRVA
jgi:hypothetical protein